MEEPRGRRMLSRRALLLAGGGAGAALVGSFAGVETGIVPGRVAVNRALGRGEVDLPVPAWDVGPVTYRSFRSARRGADVTWGVGLPPAVATAGLPVVLVLHGRGADAHSGFTALHLQAFLADHVRRGGRPLALVSVDGADPYWHPRANGDDPLGMILEELLPRAADLGLRTARIGVTGWSMGGYASLLLARESEHDRLGGLVVAAAAASSPALFSSYAASAPGAFDDAADWDRWGDLSAHPGVRSTALRVSCGTSDPFADQTRLYRQRCARRPAGGLGAGRHDNGYWRSLLPGHLEFLGEHLA